MEVYLKPKIIGLNGTFDGKYHKLTNIKIGGKLSFTTDEAGSVGLFTRSCGIIKNLGLIMNSTLTVNSVNKFFNIGLIAGSIRI